MKTKLLMMLTVLASAFQGNAQIGHQRGLYVNRFIALDGNGNIDINNTILGNPAKETTLLQYCMENHFTYLTLYSLSNIEGDGTIQTEADKRDLLCDFICKAKTEYCVEFVGGVVPDNESSITGLLRQSRPFIFDDSFHGTDLYSRLSFLEETITSEDDRFYNAESLKLALRLIMSTAEVGVGSNTCCPQGHIDVMSTEYEFWGAEYWTRSGINNDFQELLRELDGIRDLHNIGVGNVPCYVEVYIDRIRDSHNPALLACEIVDYMDNDYFNADPLLNSSYRQVDRFLATSYNTNPDFSYNPPGAGAHASDYVNRFLLFCEVDETSATTWAPLTVCNGNSYSTNENTNYQPLFHAGSIAQGSLGNNLGIYFPGANDRNIFTAERDFYDDFFADNNHSYIHDGSIGNDVVPGGSEWFARTVMTPDLDHPITFLAYATACPSGATQEISLVYQGPIEAGIGFTYSVTDCVSGAVQSPVGLGLNTGTTPLYIGTTTTDDLYTPVKYDLPSGTYCVSLFLNYAAGCGYTYNQKIIVSDDFQIQSLHNPGNAKGPFTICEGKNVLLQANWNITTATYQWYHNGIAINGATTYQYAATEGGDYFCMIDGVACTGSSNIISINVNNNPFRTIVAECPLSSSPGTVSLNITPVISGDNFLWSDLSTNSTLNVTAANTYTVNITNTNGCSSTVSQLVSSAMLTGLSSALTTPTLTIGNNASATSPPSPLCPWTQVRIRVDNLVAGAPAGFIAPWLWSTGAVTPTLPISNPIPYSAIFSTTGGCEVEAASVTPVYDEAPQVKITPENPTVCSGTYQMLLTASVTPGIGTAPYTYSWAPAGAVTCSNSCLNATPNVTQTTNLTVFVTDDNGCISSATTTYSKLGGCDQITKTVSPEKQYATLPVTYTITACNTDFATSSPHTFTLTDDPTVGTSINTIWQNPFSSVLWPSNNSTPITTQTLQPGQCASYNMICSYNNVGENCNDAFITQIDGVAVGSSITSEACFENLMNCPMNVACKVAGCTIESHVSVKLRNHKDILPSLKYFKVRLVYPNFMTPSIFGDYNADPSASPPELSNPIVPGSTSTVSNLDVIHSTMSPPLAHSGSPGGYFINYNYVDVEIQYINPVVSPRVLADFDFTFNAAPPAGINSFHIFVVDPVSDEENHTFLGLSGTAGSLSYWTQAVGTVIPGCSGIYGPDADFDINYIGCGGEVNVTSHYTGNYASKWEFGDDRSTPIFGSKDWTYDYFAPITQTQNGPVNPATASAGPGTYTITHTVYDGNNVASVITHEVTIGASCCEVEPGVEVLDESTSSSYGSDFTNQLVHIQGDFIIDDDFSIDHSTLIMEDGASIFVESGKTLTANHSYFYTCSGMWQGIGLDGNAHFNSNASMIENATTAVGCSETSGISIISSVFNKNTRGISIPGSGNNTISSFDGYIMGSVFTSRELEHNGIATLAANLRSEDDLININSYGKTAGRSKTGIEIFNYGVSSSTPTYDVVIGDKDYTYLDGGNLFDNHDWGIKSFKSNVKVINNAFQEMAGYDKSSYSTGIGVWAYSKANSTNEYSLKIGGTNTNEKNTFLNCGIGVLASDYTNVSVLYNSIDKTAGFSSSGRQNYYGHFGVKLTNHNVSNYDCNNNSITNMYYGIEWSQSTSKLAHCIFKFNDISTTVSTENCFAAIYLHGPTLYDQISSTIFVDRNTITNTWNGILVYNFLAPGLVTISQNDDILIRNGHFPQYGVKILNTRYAEITDNSKIRSTSKDNLNVTGVYLVNSERAKINCNSIFDLGTGVGFSRSCITKSSEGVLHRNLFSNYSRAMHIEVIATIGNQGSSAHAADNEWTNPGGASFDIQNDNALQPQFFVQSNSSPYQPAVINPANSVTFTLAGTTNTTCNTSNTTPAATYTLTTDERNAIEKEWREGVVFPVLETQTKWMYAETDFEKLMRDTTISPSDSILYNYRDSIHNTNIGKFYDVNTSLYDENWTQAESDNSAISYHNHIEENLKKFNSYYIAYRLDTTLGEDTTWLADMVSNLSPIAAECYSTGGTAVLSSRTMLSYFTNEIFEENLDCYKSPADSIIADSTNSACDFIKNYSVASIVGATYTWTVPTGTSFTQTGNSIALNWGSKILNGGTITCSIMDSLGNISSASYTQDTLITSPSCVTVTANNTSCVSATNLSWIRPSGCALGYYVMLGTNGGGTSVPNNILDSADVGNVTSYMLPFLNPSTTHYYKVIPYNNSHIPVSGCSIGSFSSGSSVSYTPTLSSPYLQNFDGVTAPALPCGITTTDENFPQDGVSWKTSSGASCSGSNSIAIAKNSNNSTAKDDWFYSNPLNLTAGELYRIKFKKKGQSGHTESVEAFISNSNDAATMLATSAIINTSYSSTSCTNDSGDFVCTSTGQYFVGVHANSSANQGTLYIDDLKVSLIKTTHLTTTSCGDSLKTCDTIHCITYTSATSYKFKFEDLGNSFSQEYTVSSKDPKVYQFLGTNPLPLGHTYSVTVSATTGGGIWSPYGAACDVYINPVPTTGLTGGSCGGTLSDLSQLIYANTTGICSIADYKYEFTDQSNSVVIETQRNSATTSFLLTYITTPYVKYSTTYSVRVKLKIGNSWGSYGSACNVTTPASPLTQLSSTYCNTTLSNFNSTVTSNSVLGVQDYRYHITGPSSYNKTFARNAPSNTWNFYWTKLCCGGQNMLANSTYNVEVATQAGGVWSSYGTSCTITTPNAVRLADTSALNEFLQPDSESVKSLLAPLSMSVFPNPNNYDHEFSIELKGIAESNQKVELSIFNIIGASVYKSKIVTKEENQFIIKPQVALMPGVYFVEVNVSGTLLRKKFIVQ